MNHTNSEDLQYIVEKMDGLGLNTDHVEALQRELCALKEPWLQRIQSSLSKHWTFLREEIKETGELALLLNKSIKTDLSEEEKGRVKSQLMDFLKLFPAGCFASANAILPIPGTSMLTPLVLQKAGLLPSQWHSARIVSLLQEEEKQLRKKGHTSIATQLEQTRLNIVREDQERQKHYSLLLHWDLNKNGKWDPDELELYKQEVEKVKALAVDHQHQSKWYVLQSGMVFGPTTFARLPVDDSEMLVCFESQSKWVNLSDLTDVAHLRGQASENLLTSSPQSESMDAVGDQDSDTLSTISDG